MTQTTKDAIENIDFAARHHLQYILFDWKWYGPAFSFNSDATKVAIPNFDLPAIIKYGSEKGVGVWLYCNLQGLYGQSDSLFRIYHEWGVKGVKFGYKPTPATSELLSLFRAMVNGAIRICLDEKIRGRLNLRNRIYRERGLYLFA